MADMLKYARAYAKENGSRKPLPIFPLSEGQKTPLIGKKRGGNGCLDATTDLEQINKWWSAYPNANIGIATGEQSGIIVIDIDIKHHEGKFGDESFEELEKTLGALPDTWEVITPSGGRHIYLKYPEGYDIRNSESKLGQWIDVRANGGYVVAPPSTLKNGLYEWDAGLTPNDTPLAEIPETWLKSLTAQTAKKTQKPLFVLPDEIKNGERNSTLFNYCYSLRQKGTAAVEILSLLKSANAERCSTPLPQNEIERIYNSCMSYDVPVRSESCESVYSALKKSKSRKNGVEVETVQTTAENYLKIFSLDAHFENVRFNLMRGYPEQIIKGKRVQWSDADDAKARNYIERNYNISNRQKYEDAFSEFQHQREYHPVQNLLNSIEWDGVKRCETFLIKWMGAVDNEYNREVSRLMFAGGINRAFNPGCKFDDVTVLVGAQGGGKSTICRWLALEDDFYSSTKTISGQRGLESIQGKWIVEIEELLAVLANDKQGSKVEETAKAFLSTQSDFYRKPYDRRPMDNPRHCIFIGTTNRDEFLTDKTGNRRWYPVRCNSDASYIYSHKEDCKNDIRQCWAEMLTAYKNAEAFAQPNARRDLLNEIRAQQAGAECEDYREGVIREYLSDKDRTCVLELWYEALGNDYAKPQKRDSNEIGAILVNHLGWQRGGVSNFGTTRDGKILGSQKSFIRVEPITPANELPF